MKIIASKPFITYGNLRHQPFETFRNGERIEDIWEDIKVFLDACTTTSRDKPTYVELGAYEQTYKVNENKVVARKIFKDLHDTFGEGQTDPEIEGYPVHTYWDIDPKDLHKAVDYLIKGQPWPTYSFGPIQLRMSYYFNLVDPTTKKELDGQEFESFLLVFLSGKSICNANLSFPFSEPDENFRDYLLQIDKYLPFDLKSEYLRLCKSNKNGTSNYSRKLSDGGA